MGRKGEGCPSGRRRRVFEDLAHALVLTCLCQHWVGETERAEGSFGNKPINLPNARISY